MGYPSHAAAESRSLLGAVPHGDNGTRATLKAMRAVVRAALARPLVIETAHRIARGLPARDMRARALAVRSWLAAHFHFERDPSGVELLRTPEYQLRQLARDGVITGDCDDAAILGAALYAALGGRAALRAVSFRPRSPFTHVYAILTPQSKHASVSLDVTKPRGVNPAVHRSATLGV